MAHMCGVGLLRQSYQTLAAVPTQLKSRAKKQEDTIVHVTQELEHVRAEVCAGALLCAAEFFSLVAD